MKQVNTEKKLEDICSWHKPSRNQRNTESIRKNNVKGIDGYLIMGCYDCNGHNYGKKCYHKTEKKS